MFQVKLSWAYWDLNLIPSTVCFHDAWSARLTEAKLSFLLYCWIQLETTYFVDGCNKIALAESLSMSWFYLSNDRKVSQKISWWLLRGKSPCCECLTSTRAHRGSVSGMDTEKMGNTIVGSYAKYLFSVFNLFYF